MSLEPSEVKASRLACVILEDLNLVFLTAESFEVWELFILFSRTNISSFPTVPIYCHPPLHLTLDRSGSLQPCEMFLAG